MAYVRLSSDDYGKLVTEVTDWIRKNEDLTVFSFNSKKNYFTFIKDYLHYWVNADYIVISPKSNPFTVRYDYNGAKWFPYNFGEQGHTTIEAPANEIFKLRDECLNRVLVDRGTKQLELLKEISATEKLKELGAEIKGEFHNRLPYYEKKSNQSDEWYFRRIFTLTWWK